MAFVAAGDSAARKRALLENQQLESAAQGIMSGLKSYSDYDTERRKAALLAEEKQQVRIDKANEAEEKANAEWNKQERDKEKNKWDTAVQIGKDTGDYSLANELGPSMFSGSYKPLGNIKRISEEDKFKETQRHNKAMEGLAGQRALRSQKPVKTEEQGLAEIEKEATVKTLATSTANMTPIKNELDTFLANAPSYNKDQLLTQGKLLVKTLNSTQGKDAVGAEEANRLASKLDFALGNLTNSNPTQFGRDLPGFVQQVKDTSDKLGGTIIRNRQELGKYTGGAKTQQSMKIPQSAQDISQMSDEELEAFINAN